MRDTAGSNGWPLTIISDLRERSSEGARFVSLLPPPRAVFANIIRENALPSRTFSIRGLRAERDMKQRHQFRLRRAHVTARHLPTYMPCPKLLRSTDRFPGEPARATVSVGGPVHPSIPGSFAREPRRGIVIVSIVKEGARGALAVAPSACNFFLLS